MKLFRNLFGLVVLGSALFFLNSCAKETTQDEQLSLTSGLENLSASVVILDNGTANDGKPCYVLLFPLKVQVGRDVVTVNSQEELDRLMKKPTTTKTRPVILFPYGVKLVATGEVLRITNQRDLDQVLKNCGRTKRDTIIRDTNRHACYEFVFPLNVVFSDGTNKTVNSQEEFNALHKLGTTRISFRIEFPFDVTLSNGNKLTISSKEELMRLERSCTDRRGGGH
ncbi:MAG: hypothetical protein ABI851_02250 [Saprospiraceae bacterium]